MASGHTDRATINQRRPLTPTMIDLMRSVRRREAKVAMNGFASNLFWGELSQAEKNASRALADRGLLTYTHQQVVVQTDAGKALEID